MKTILKLTVLLICIIISCHFLANTKFDKKFQGIQTQVEALASGEDSNTLECIGEGPISCAHKKVDYKASTR